MITLTNWLITNNIMTADVVMYHMPERVIKTQFNIKTEEFKVWDDLEEVDRAYIKKALITVYIRFRDKKAKQGTKQVVAYG